MNHMHSFTFRDIGNLVRNPEVLPYKSGTYTRFCLINNDVYANDEDTMPVVISVWFMATGQVGEEIAEQARKGDQLFVEGMILRDHSPKYPNEGRDDFAFFVLGYRFGARRRPPGAANGTSERRSDSPVRNDRTPVNSADLRHKNHNLKVGDGRSRCQLGKRFKRKSTI